MESIYLFHLIILILTSDTMTSIFKLKILVIFLKYICNINIWFFSDKEQRKYKEGRATQIKCWKF